MKRFMLLLLLISLAFNRINSQWSNTSTTAISDSFFSASYSSASTCVMIGYKTLSSTGAIIRSTDGGQTWATISQTVNPLFDIATILIAAPISTTYFVTVSYKGNIYISSNNGQSFAAIAQVLPAALYGVSIGSNYNAYAVGILATNGKIYNSSSVIGGTYTYWQDISPKSAKVQLNAVTTVDGINIVVVGNSGTIYYSFNSGGVWQQPATQITTQTLICVSSKLAAGSMFAAAAGLGATVIVTSNGGSSWVSASLPSTVTSSSFNFHAISVVSATVIYICSNNGYILHTNNGGFTWTLDGGYTGSTKSTLTAITMYSASVGVVGTNNAPKGGVIYRRISNPTQSPTPMPTGQPTSHPTGQPSTQPSG